MIHVEQNSMTTSRTRISQWFAYQKSIPTLEWLRLLLLLRITKPPKYYYLPFRSFIVALTVLEVR